MKRIGLGLVVIGGAMVFCVPFFPKVSLIAIALFLGGVAVVTSGFILVYRPQPSRPFVD